MKIVDNFFTSGWDFAENMQETRSHYQMLNIGLVLSSIGLIFGMTSNYIKGDYYLIYIEILLILMNVFLFFILRKERHYFNLVANPFTAQFALLFIFLMYTSEPGSMKHVWLFTFPIIILYYRETKTAILWLLFLFSMILVAPFQSFVEVTYTLHQTMYILFVVMIVSSTMYFYKMKIDEAKRLIVEKDKLLTIQSKQAVMGEMITMIAHQWRQPLSTVTLQISNLQFKKLLGEELSEDDVSKTLNEVSDTIIYLSDTIDDFQTYFHPEKDVTEIEVHELLRKAINFTLPRLKESAIDVKIKEVDEIFVKIYMNELIQVILNLLNNAIDSLVEFDPPNPRLTLEVKEIKDQVLIYVRDNSSGIDAEILPHIFEPYFSTKDKNGTGLGLYMSQMIIQKQFNGKIEVQSSSRGSTFIIHIPKVIS